MASKSTRIDPSKPTDLQRTRQRVPPPVAVAQSARVPERTALALALASPAQSLARVEPVQGSLRVAQAQPPQALEFERVPELAARSLRVCSQARGAPPLVPLGWALPPSTSYPCCLTALPSWWRGICRVRLTRYSLQ